MNSSSNLVVKILHHDVRCENVLITENMQPKIYNFKFSREINAATIQIDDINAIIHWLAPEKLNHISTEKDSKKAASYTIQCDIFRLVSYYFFFFLKKIK
jgi:serine/threonine protein kinase